MSNTTHTGYQRDLFKTTSCRSGEVWQSGGYKWTSTRREDYASGRTDVTITVTIA